MCGTYSSGGIKNVNCFNDFSSEQVTLIAPFVSIDVNVGSLDSITRTDFRLIPSINEHINVVDLEYKMSCLLVPTTCRT